MTTDWKSLAKETAHSFDADEVRGMWDVDFRRATRVFLTDHDARIEHVLLRKAGARPYETVSALVLELDRFLGRVACDDDVSIAVIRRKTA